MQTDNIYIKALKIGIDHMESGITYNHMISELKKAGFDILLADSNAFSKLFNHWFLTTFYDFSTKTSMDSPEKRSVKAGQLIGDPRNRKLQNNKKKYISYQAYMEYIDYVELQEARRASQKAQENAKKSIKIATWAVGISAFLALLSIIVQILQGVFEIAFKFIFPY
ncbi:MAG: hypothetical protein R6T99_01605 [Bacteroidales bacterium]